MGSRRQCVLYAPRLRRGRNLGFNRPTEIEESWVPHPLRDKLEVTGGLEEFR